MDYVSAPFMIDKKYLFMNVEDEDEFFRPAVRSYLVRIVWNISEYFVERKKEDVEDFHNFLFNFDEFTDSIHWFQYQFEMFSNNTNEINFPWVSYE